MIYLNQIPQNQLNRLQNDKVVSVNVLNRSGDKAEVEVNGIKMSATLETDTPDRFLAFLVKDDNGIQLRLLSSFKNTDVYKQINREQIADRLSGLLYQEGLPLNEENLRAGIRLLEGGVNPNKHLIKLIKMVEINFGKPFGDMILGLLRQDSFMDMTLPEILYRLKEIYREGLSDRAFRYDPEKGFIQPQSDDPKPDLFQIHVFLQQLFGRSFDAKLLEYGDDRLTVFGRKKGKDSAQSYIFDLTSDLLGQFLIEVAWGEQDCRLVIRMEPTLYEELKENLDRKRPVLINRLNDYLIERQVTIQFREIVHPFEFYLIDNESSTETITNLDIFA